ncbi:MAG: right-handed parallel beta-helix repeat-containing protein [bacterium]
MPEFRLRFVWLALLACTLLVNPLSEGKTIHVPGDSTTIQRGILGAVSGDTVLVAAGEYPDSNTALQGRDIVVISEAGPEATIIHGSFIFIPSDNSEPIIDGFTIRDDGPLITCFFGANPLIRNCIISDGDSTDIGGAVMAASSSPRFENCTFARNRATDAGSAIFAVRADEAPRCSVTVVDCRFLHNKTTGPPTRGGIDIHANQGAEVYVTNSLFVGDSTSTASCAFEWNSLISFDNCTFSGYEYWLFEIENDSAGPRLELDKCVIDYGTALAFLLTEFPDSVALTRSILYGWGPVVPESTITIHFSNYLRANPLFCDTAADDYHISDTSPALPANNPWGVQLGAYGAGCSLPYICGDANGDGAVSMTDVVFTINYIFVDDPEVPSPPAAADPDCTGDISMSDVIYWIQYIFVDDTPPPCDTDNDGEPDC